MSSIKQTPVSRRFTATPLQLLSPVPYDIDIAQSAQLKPISQLAGAFSIPVSCASGSKRHKGTMLLPMPAPKSMKRSPGRSPARTASAAMVAALEKYNGICPVTAPRYTSNIRMKASRNQPGAIPRVEVAQASGVKKAWISCHHQGWRVILAKMRATVPTAKALSGQGKASPRRPK